MVLLRGFLKFLCWGVFMQFLVDIKLVSTPQTKIWLFFALKDAEYIAWTLYAIFSACSIAVSIFFSLKI